VLVSFGRVADYAGGGEAERGGSRGAEDVGEGTEVEGVLAVQDNAEPKEKREGIIVGFVKGCGEALV